MKREKDWMLGDLWTYSLGCHAGHLLDFLAAFLCYLLLYQDGAWLDEAKEFRVGWVSRIVLFNLCCELVVCNFWHFWSYCSPVYNAYVEGGVKLTPTNQYEPDTGKAGMFTSSTGNLEREITFTTLGWLQSSAWQCLFTYCWANNYLPFYANFLQYPVYSFLVLWLIAYWREIHFFCAHRGMHPWWDRKNGLKDGDIGAFLYRHAHSLHHKSYNPGPWSGLCMHPIEHFLYYTCATLPPLFMAVHPLHFLYCKFHADIAPIGGHDGMDEPGGKGDFHWLHHAKFECNYGVPFPLNLDLAFGTWADFDTYKETGELTVGDWAKNQMHLPEEEEGAEKPEKQQPLLKAESSSTKEETDKVYSVEDVAAHNTDGDLWVMIYGKVLDVSKFMKVHPGGKDVLLQQAGKDATSEFEKIHASSGGFSLVAKWGKNGLLQERGTVSNYTGPAPPTASAKSSGGGGTKWPGALLFYPVLLAFAAIVKMS